MRTPKFMMLVPPLAVALSMTPALAHGPHRGGACRQDLQALCPSVTPGPGAFRDCLATLCPDLTPGPGAFASCLQQHASQLSPACQEHLNQMQAKMTAWQQACGSDVQTFCSDVTPGPWSVGKCLHAHKSELSQPCQDLLAQYPRHRHHHHTCGTPPPGSSGQ
jgi:hypothetical protein